MAPVQRKKQYFNISISGVSDIFIVIYFNSSAKICNSHEPVNSKPYNYTQTDYEASVDSFQKKKKIPTLY